MAMDTPELDLTADAPAAGLPDEQIVKRIRGGDRALFEILMRRHNQRLYRVARAVVKDEAEVEDVMQQAYVNAFTHLHQFQERARFSTWMTRITLNEAFGRRRKMRRSDTLTASDGNSTRAAIETVRSPLPDPERQAYGQELSRVLEAAIDTLPERYRTVFMLRDIEGLSTGETCDGLGLGEEVVKTRLHRARAMIRDAVTARVGAAGAAAFQFHAPRCDRVVAAVLARIG
jgi:RNA polymerase sigma-70 factor (ECF subfamily)